LPRHRSRGINVRECTWPLLVVCACRKRCLLTAPLNRLCTHPVAPTPWGARHELATALADPSARPSAQRERARTLSVQYRCSMRVRCGARWAFVAARRPRARSDDGVRSATAPSSCSAAFHSSAATLPTRRCRRRPRCRSRTLSLFGAARRRPRALPSVVALSLQLSVVCRVCPSSNGVASRHYKRFFSAAAAATAAVPWAAPGAGAIGRCIGPRSNRG